ncbi:EpsG family protein [Mesobacillus foraminis]|uniref:Transmembrane protein EpsG n=1 Tax=Mesobacillus foraminis TaxID=279826 RepID=A0A4R2B5Z7_9BACI|nr:EpsG family protein [Mesobacillus foraminis]TCN22188.1 transmembrane protein EpsG [Mesobacillus foraminis]
MTILWINLALVFLLSYFARYFALIPTGTYIPATIRPSKILMLGTMLCFVLVSGLRTNIGDTFFYMHAFEMHDFTWDFILSQKDIGFGVLQMILRLQSNDAQILIFTTAAITNILIIFVLYKYSRLFEISIYFYITGGLFLVSMNGLRQFLAASIVFAATNFLIERSTLKYFLIVIFASTFHISALVLIPIYFFVKYRAWSKATLVLLAFALLIVLGFEWFSSFLFSTIKDTQYGEYQSFAEGGANFLRVGVCSVPIIVAYMGREKLRRIFPESDYIVNLSLIGLAIMLIATQNWIFARLAIYFQLYQIILVGWIVKLFSERQQRFVYYGIIVCYFLYYYYECVISLNIVYKSNFFNIP